MLLCYNSSNLEHEPPLRNLNNSTVVNVSGPICHFFVFQDQGGRILAPDQFPESRVDE